MLDGLLSHLRWHYCLALCIGRLHIGLCRGVYCMCLSILSFWSFEAIIIPYSSLLYHDYDLWIMTMTMTLTDYDYEAMTINDWFKFGLMIHWCFSKQTPVYCVLYTVYCIWIIQYRNYFTGSGSCIHTALDVLEAIVTSDRPGLIFLQLCRPLGHAEQLQFTRCHGLRKKLQWKM